MKKNLIVVILVLNFFSFDLLSQEIRVSGYVKDKASDEIIQLANVWVKGTYNGVSTNMEGYFSLKINLGDTLCFSSVGYSQAEKIIDSLNKKTISVFLKENIQSINEVTVKPKVDYGKELFKKIIEKKKQNADVISEISNYKTLSNTTIYLVMDSTLGKPGLIDTLRNKNKEIKTTLKYTPIYLSEEAFNVEDNYFDLAYGNTDGIFPKLNQTIESLISQYLVVDLDFYKNQIYIFDRGFISPISNNALLQYNIFFNDSTFVEDEKFYNFSFTPKNKFAPLFTGKFSVYSESLALSNIEVYFRKEANVNFVNGFKGNVKYKEQKEGGLFLDKQKIDINLAIIPEKDTAGTYASNRVDNISNGDWLLRKTTFYSTEKELNNVKASEWKNLDEFKLKELNEDEYEQVEKLKKRPIVRAIDAVGGMVLTSYINLPKFDIGPVFDIYSTNAIEGNRFTGTFRTGEQLAKHFTIGGFVGYGTKSKEFKYGGNIGWQPFKSDKYVLRLNYADDYTLISQDKFLRYIKKNPNTRGNGNFIAALTTRERDPYLKEEKKIELRLEYNADRHFDMEVTSYFLENYSTTAVRFIHEDVDYTNYQNYGALINFRFAFGQHYDKLYFARVYYLTQIPVINLTMDVGQVKLPDGKPDDLGLYAHFHGAIQGMYNLGAIAIRYMINGGYLIGDAPYDMLDMPVGSQSLGFAKYRYNLLYQATFANNLYSNAHLEFSGGGIILNRIPLIRNLKLREIASLKSHYGTLDNVYNGIFDLPEYYNNRLTYPYTELGVGLTNIFKIIRVEYVRQVGDYHTKENLADKYGVRFRAELSF